jgi:predicted nucleic acid-binding protein
MYEAGRLKTTYAISLADAIACATAGSLRATLVTSDHKELTQVEQDENLSVLWLPPRPKK